MIAPTTIDGDVMTDDTIDTVSKAMRRAWQLGQTYWQQADSDSYKQNNKSDETKQKFETLVDETRALLSTSKPAAPAQSGEPVAHILPRDLEALKTYSLQCQVVLYREPRGTRVPLYAAPQPTLPAKAGEPITKEWCLKMAALEPDEGVPPAGLGAGVLDDEWAAYEVWLKQERSRRCDFSSLAGSWARAAWDARAASPQATETQLVGWFVQRSKFGPWIETESHEPGAVQFYRAAQPESRADHD